MGNIISMVKADASKLSYKKSIFVGLGFFIITAIWTLYNSYVPIFLERFVKSEFIIGVIMTFDNIAAITLQPLFGALSDNTNTRYGRRLPFILIGAPIAAIFFALIPLANSFYLLLIILVVLNFSMSIFRSPVVSLMPDLTPKKLRSKANGLVNFMGGIGAAISLYFGAHLYNVDPSIPFIFLSILLVIIILLYLWKIKEPEQAEKQENTNLIEMLKDIFSLIDRNILYILLAIFFWFFGYSGVETFFTLYGKNFLFISESLASQRLAFFSITFLLLAIPSGYLASKIGRKRTICFGISGLLAVFIVLIYLRNINYITYSLLAGGVFWALININSYPMIVDSSEGKIGTLTGIYYFFSTLAAILSPMIVGKIIEMAGYGTIFITASISLIFSLFFMIKVKEKE